MACQHAMLDPAIYMCTVLKSTESLGSHQTEFPLATDTWCPYVAGWPYLHDDGSEGFNLVHVAGSEAGALMRVEHDQVDLALYGLHQLHKPVDTSALVVA